MCPELIAAFSMLFAPASLRPIVNRLRARFSNLCPGLVEDAVSTAAVELYRSPTVLPVAWARGGVVEIRRVLIVASWRACLRQLRGPRSRRELLLEVPDEGQTLDDPETLLLCREVEAELAATLGRSARRFGGRRAPALALALNDRLGGDETDGEIAHRHGFSRETLNRAKRWMADQLSAA